MNGIKIFISGHKGMVGSAILRLLKKKNVKLLCKDRKELDLTNQKKVINFLNKERPDEIYIAAAKAGGIYANSTYPADFIYTNIMIEANLIHSAFKCGIKKILLLGSSCIYPRNSKQPIKEEELLNGYLEPTNEPYAIAKIAGIKMCESYNRQYGLSHGIDFRCVMPTNLYGPHDSYSPLSSHVIPALIRKFHEAKIKKKPYVVIWGTGLPRREFLHVDDLARACVRIMKIKKIDYKNFTKENCSHINVGSGYDLTILELAKKIMKIVGYVGDLRFDSSKPDGMRQKLLDSSRIRKLGWKPKINLEDGLVKVYKNYQIYLCKQ